MNKNYIMQKRLVIFGLFLFFFTYFMSAASAANAGVTNSGKSKIQEMDIGQVQTSGIEKWVDSLGITIEIDYDALKKSTTELRQALDSCPLPVIIDCDARCGGLKSIAGENCYQDCDGEQDSKNDDYINCLFEFDDKFGFSLQGEVGWGIGQLVSLKADQFYESSCPSFTENLNEAQACEKTCPGSPNNPDTESQYYECWIGICMREEMKQNFNTNKCEVQADAAAKEYFQKWLELVGDGVASPSVAKSVEEQQNNIGTEPYERINPSIWGYLGDAYVVRSDGTKVIPGKELYLSVEDKLITGKNSKLNFIFKDAGGINLGPNTELRVGSALLDQYYLARGSLKTKLNWGTLPPQKLEFHTPNAAITVKGTEFVIDYNETANATTVYLHEGVLEINVNNKITNLEAGNYLIIYADGTIKANQLNSENWNSLSDNFYDDSEKAFKKIMWIIFYVDIIIILLLTLWTGKKIKNLDKNDKSTSKGTASVVLAIFGGIFLFAPYIGVILSAIAFCLSKIQKANKPTGLAKAGFVLGLIGFILNMIMLFYVFL